MNSDPGALDRLCAKCGVEGEYYDIWGQHRRAPEATKLSLLRAMGIVVGHASDAMGALAEIEEQEWRRALPPVKVVRDGEPPSRLVLTLPTARAGECNWLLKLENGERTAGPLRTETQHVLATREIDGTPCARYAVDLPPLPSPGYHSYSLTEAGSGNLVASMTVIACPARCHQGLADEQRIWGPAVQLYAQRSARNWGIGDFGDLNRLVDFAGQAGAGIVGLNPLHALFPDRPPEASPYRPSNRTRLNVLYLDVEAIADFNDCEPARRRAQAPGFQARLRALRDTDLVDYAGVARAKSEVLELMYRHFRERQLAPVTLRAREFRDFQATGGEPLRRHALFEALQEHFGRRNPALPGWTAWPDAYRTPDSAAVAAFGLDHAERVEYFEYLQWQADLQLGASAQRARALGLPVGLYQDLAVGAHPDGAETWMQPGLHALSARIGAPPDDFNLNGQDWGMPPWIPQRLAGAGYAPFVATLRSAMRHAGALRIDHVMGLMRLYWIPAGAGPGDGTYVSYPFDDLLGILALESQRNRCLVIGEDLGTVPDAVRAAMSALGILSYRPMYFARAGDGEFSAPETYPRAAVVTVGTHDLPTLRGWWRGSDLAARAALALFPTDELRLRQLEERARDRRRLLAALARAGLLPEGVTADAAGMQDIDDAMAQAVHAYAARTPARILMVQLEDVLGQVEQVNLPGTTDERYPNWRRKLALDPDTGLDDPRLTALAGLLRETRGSRPPPRARSVTIPRATYRLQFHKGFTFAHAAALVPYLAALGVSHIYASPYLKARPGSTHGYDITDHNALNPEIGPEDDFEQLVATLKRHGMGQVLDLVPNHMGIMYADNAWWLDVLENGPASAYAGYFDIEWEPLNEELRGKVLVPILGEPYATVLENGQLKLAFDAALGEFSVYYHEHRFPLDPREYPRVLGPALDRLAAAAGGSHPAREEFRALVAALAGLPARNELAPQRAAERVRAKEVCKRELAGLCERAPELARLIVESVHAIIGRPGEPASFDALHELIEAQAWRLAHWRVAADDINYRRFFDINDLAALRMESAAVFEDTHRLVLGLVAAGKVDGLRIDHPDGLYDPPQYFERLQSRACPEPGGAGGVYIALEKVLAEHERMPEHWPVHGTTGYRYLNVVNGIFVDGAATERLDRIYAAFIGRRINYEDLARDTRILIMTTALASELNVLAYTLNRIAQADRRTRDYTLNTLRRALVDIVAAFPVYRTYATVGGMRGEDRRYVDWAVALAKKHSQIAETGVFDFIRSVLTGARPGSDAARAHAASFIGRFQQFTAPVMAKALEDTSFYIYNRLVSLNEVGGDPRTFGMSLNAFHAASQDRARTWPHTMLATSTHDNKRSEDVRARINVLSEMPAPWRLLLRRWSRLNRRKKTPVNGDPAPSPNDEYLLYQTLLGAWPIETVDQAGLDAFRGRIQRYMLKAVREAKVHSSWLNPDNGYERALASFIDALLKSVDRNPFLNDFLPAQARIARYGMFNSLSQALIKFMSPGVPDLYQGNELWDFSLVDPDNRRPVDYARRAALLSDLVKMPADAAHARGLLDSMADGRVKLYVTWKALALRARHSELFERGGYQPLAVIGERAEHVCAFARAHQGTTVMVIAPRLYYGLMRSADDRLPLGTEIWGDTHVVLPDGVTACHEELTGAQLAAEQREGKPALLLAEVFANFPVALLTTERAG